MIDHPRMIRCTLCLFLGSLALRLTAQVGTHWATPVGNAPTLLLRAPDDQGAPLTRLTSDNVLLVRCDSTAWCWAQDEEGRTGYVRANAIELLSERSDSSATAWMRRVFAQQRDLGLAFHAAHEAGNDTLGRSLGRALNAHDSRHLAALQLFAPYYCRTGDNELLRLFYLSVAANPGSASEEPPNKLAACFICKPAEFLWTLRTLDANDEATVRDATRTGLWLLYDERDPAQQAERDNWLHQLE